MGYSEDSDLPTESRRLEQPQRHPAPGSSFGSGAYNLGERPEHPVLQYAKAPGLPIVVKVDSLSPTFSDVDCKLYKVDGDMKHGERDDEIKCHLSYANHNAPAGFPAMFSMVALTPYRILAAGVYEADFKFTQNGEEHAYKWRFRIGR